MAPPTVGLCHKLGEIKSDSPTMRGLFGIHNKFSSNDTGTTAGQSTQYPTRMPEYRGKTNMLSQSIITIDRQTHRLRYGRVTGSSTLSASTDAENESVIQGRSKLQHHVEIDPRVSGGNSMVAILPEGLEWQGDYNTSPRSNNHVRCLDERMGVGMQWCDYPGHVEQRGAITPYKCTGVTCSNVCSEIFHKGKKKHSCTYEGGQQRHSSSNKQDGGGTRSQDLLNITKDLWQYSLLNGITLTAEHLPGVLNTTADWESRVFTDRSNWKLQTAMFDHIEKIFGEVQVDLFAERINAQKPKYVSWKPDPGAMAMDAFSLNWSQISAYAFPPFCLIGRCLAKIRKDQATVVIIAPVWPGQPWYATLLGMVICQPFLLPPGHDVITSPQGEPHPLAGTQSLTLAAWKVSGTDSLQKVFQQNLPHCCWNQGDLGHKWLTKAPGENGVAGVVKGGLIRFRPLWAK